MRALQRSVTKSKAPPLEPSDSTPEGTTPAPVKTEVEGSRGGAGGGKRGRKRDRSRELAARPKSATAFVDGLRDLLGLDPLNPPRGAL